MNGLEASSVVLGVREVPRGDKVPGPVCLLPSFLPVTLFEGSVGVCWEKARCNLLLWSQHAWTVVTSGPCPPRCCFDPTFSGLLATVKPPSALPLSLLGTRSQ